jgi:hypothetical protein
MDALAGVPAAVLAGLQAMTRGDLAGITPESFNDHAPIYYALRTWNSHVAAQAGIKAPALGQ